MVQSHRNSCGRAWGPSSSNSYLSLSPYGASSVSMFFVPKWLGCGKSYRKLLKSVQSTFHYLKLFKNGISYASQNWKECTFWSVLCMSFRSPRLIKLFEYRIFVFCPPILPHVCTERGRSVKTSYCCYGFVFSCLWPFQTNLEFLYLPLELIIWPFWNVSFLSLVIFFALNFNLFSSNVATPTFFC